MGNQSKRLTAAAVRIAPSSIAMLLAAVTLAHAGEGAGPITESWAQLLGYIGCAMGIAFASTTGQLWAAGLGCARMLLGELGV